MTLAVLGNESLDELQSLVEELFTGVPNKDLPLPFWPSSPYGPENLPKLLELTPIKDKRTLSLNFPIPYTVPFYKTQVSPLSIYLNWYLQDCNYFCSVF